MLYCQQTQIKAIISNELMLLMSIICVAKPLNVY